MKKILLLGAGLSTHSLVKYLLEHAENKGWQLLIADANEDLARERAGDHPNATPTRFEVFDTQERNTLIANSDIVISMLPANMHHLVAESCLEHRKHMVTASYVSPEVKMMHPEALRKGILLANELGVDPGIDHMSAMKVIDALRKDDAQIYIFESNTGGLVAPEHDNNPWRYKFTWNPRNVILAGQAGGRFLHNGKYKYIPYHKLFKRTEILKVLDLGEFEVYANRDSLKYQTTYGLAEVLTMFRGTFRRPGFCEVWDALVQTGCTDDSFVIERSDELTYRDFINSFLAYNIHDSVETKLARYLGVSEGSGLMEKLKWAGFFEKEPIGLPNATPAQIVQKKLQEKLSMAPEDRDMIVMQHQFEYEMKGKPHRIVSSMVVQGKNQVDTAMAMTVGLPVAIATRLILENKITATGVQLPISNEFYEPVLKELEKSGIRFIDEEQEPTYPKIKPVV